MSNKKYITISIIFSFIVVAVSIYVALS